MTTISRFYRDVRRIKIVKSVEVSNLGPIGALSIKFEGPGVHVVTAPNGAGKSLLLDAVGKLAAGSGKAPLKDGAKRGHVEGFGARLTLGATTRHHGECEVSHLEGRFDISELVDPGVASPDAADRRRIKALVSLTGVKPDIKMFEEVIGSELVKTHASTATLTTDDLVDQAAKLKRDFERKALEQEDLAKKELAKGLGLEEAIHSIDRSQECDSATLQEGLEAALNRQSTLAERDKHATAHRQRLLEARRKLDVAQGSYTGPSVAEAASRVSVAQDEAAHADTVVENLHRQLAQAEQVRDRAYTSLGPVKAALQAAKEYAALVAQCEETLSADTVLPVEPDEMEAAVLQVANARKAVEQGAVIRKANEQALQVGEHKARSSAATAAAECLRTCAKQTDDVLSSAIQCERIRVESVDGVARLVVDHPVRGPGSPFHELSEGEKWRIAIDIAADRVGEQGLIVLRQEAWEALDCNARECIHRHAVERSVYVLAGEAIKDPLAPYEMTVEAMGGVA